MNQISDYAIVSYQIQAHTGGINRHYSFLSYEDAEQFCTWINRMQSNREGWKPIRVVKLSSPEAASLVF